ncbi:hypothetical protein ACSMXN_22075 [Jatrophihabitans sp. DSM 45814]
MNTISAYREVGSYRAAARPRRPNVLERHDADGVRPVTALRATSYAGVTGMVLAKVACANGGITGKLLRAAQVPGAMKARRGNFRRVVAVAKASQRKDDHRGRGPAVC